MEQDEIKNPLTFKVAFENIPLPVEMPQPPAYLLQGGEQATLVPHQISEEPKSVELIHFQQAVEDRRSAEIATASLYTEKESLVELNIKLLKRIHSYERFQSRVRKLFSQIKGNEEPLLETLKMVTKNLHISEKTIEELQLENDSFKSIVEHHSRKMSEADMSMFELRRQFENLADEFQLQGEMLKTYEKKSEDLLLQLEEATKATTRFQEELAKSGAEIIELRDSNKEALKRETRLTALNSDLAAALSKAQNKVRHLQDRIEMTLSEDVKAADQLIYETSSQKQITREVVMPEDFQEKNLRPMTFSISEPPPTSPAPIASAAPAAAAAAPESWNAFYKRWSFIIDQLSSHAVPLRPIPDDIQVPTEMLSSEAGDIQQSPLGK